MTALLATLLLLALACAWAAMQHHIDAAEAAARRVAANKTPSLHQLLADIRESHDRDAHAWGYLVLAVPCLALAWHLVPGWPSVPLAALCGLVVGILTDVYWARKRRLPWHHVGETAPHERLLHRLGLTSALDYVALRVLLAAALLLAVWVLRHP